jgi:hypothetical protein
VRIAVVLIASVLLCACAAPAPLPRPEPLATPVFCAVPEVQTEREKEPDRPVGEYTQRDVALYIEGLHRWGSRGWTRLDAVREWSESCVERAAVRDGGTVR